MYIRCGVYWDAALTKVPSQHDQMHDIEEHAVPKRHWLGILVKVSPKAIFERLIAEHQQRHVYGAWCLEKFL